MSNTLSFEKDEKRIVLIQETKIDLNDFIERTIELNRQKQTVEKELNRLAEEIERNIAFLEKQGENDAVAKINNEINGE